MLVRKPFWIVAVAALLGAGSPLCSQSGPLEESRFVGTWKAVVTGPGGTMEMKSTIAADGRYRGRAVANGQPLPPETGTMKAGGGRWELTADGGRRDGGTYVTTEVILAVLEVLRHLRDVRHRSRDDAREGLARVRGVRRSVG